jgi:AsmA-like C-terminal region
MHTPACCLGTFVPWITLDVDQILADHARVEILPTGRQKPLQFELANLHVTNLSPTRAAGFSAQVISPKPRADIMAIGRLGPWNARDPSSTPLQGEYKMPRCDLTTLPGLKGMLSSQGRFQGILKRLEITGDTESSDFSLSLSGRPESFRASFQAVVDASDGSASIQSMNGLLQSSPFVATGLVRNIQEDRHREIVLDVSVNQGRLEDVVPLAVKSETSPISGALRVKAKLEILPGDQDLLNRLRLDGDFAATNARFSSLDLRERLRDASRKAEGHPDDAAAGSSLSSMRGHVRLDNGAAEFSGLVFELEGATAQLNGSYQLANERLDLHGELSMEASLSQTASGAKKLLLKAAEPFFRGKHGGSRVPIKISGTRSDPKFGLDLTK